jgi:hypothetical protein
LVAGFCNFSYPPAGYFYIEEPARGLLVFGAQLVTTGVFIYGFLMEMSVNYEYEKAPGARAVMLSGIIATSAIYIWSIYDVVRIAKIKNLAHQKSGQKLSIKFSPDINLISMQNNYSPIAGLQMSITF